MKYITIDLLDQEKVGRFLDELGIVYRTSGLTYRGGALTGTMKLVMTQDAYNLMMLAYQGERSGFKIEKV